MFLLLRFGNNPTFPSILSNSGQCSKLMVSSVKISRVSTGRCVMAVYDKSNVSKEINLNITEGTPPNSLSAVWNKKKNFICDNL